MNDMEDGFFSPMFFTGKLLFAKTYNIYPFLVLISITLFLLVLNVILFCIYTRKRKRRRAEKTEFVRRHNYGNDRRPLQLYGAIGANLKSPAPNRRPESNNTNKSELLNERLSEEDDQSVRTMIVSLDVLTKLNFKQIPAS
jgi:hypothetical protein